MAMAARRFSTTAALPKNSEKLEGKTTLLRVSQMKMR
jgi:hypothetical protein